ncbi:MAG TPA: hypothetical protein VK464_05950 [Symbiobacteriaceae bacterium]|jgi:hypothetical protein|nr:hypothetical protein [Symbiobacteriaceae bacterium]
MEPAKSLYRRLPLLALLLALALLRAERGVLELQGQEGAPSRLFRLAPDPGGEGWTYALAGADGWVSTRLVLYQGEGPLVSGQSVAAWRSAVAAWGSSLAEQAEEMRKALP